MKQSNKFEQLEEQGIFRIIKDNENEKVIVALGDTPVYVTEDEEQAKQAIISRDWEMLLNVTVTLFKKIQDYEQREQRAREADKTEKVS